MTLAFIGLGLIGGSFARDLRKSDLAEDLLGVDTDPAHAARALELGLVDRVVALDEAASEADVLLLAVPVNAIETLLPRLLDTARDGQTVIDLGSTKLRIADAVREHPRRERYVAATPWRARSTPVPTPRWKDFSGTKPCCCAISVERTGRLQTALGFSTRSASVEFMTAEQHDLATPHTFRTFRMWPLTRSRSLFRARRRPATLCRV